MCLLIIHGHHKELTFATGILGVLCHGIVVTVFAFTQSFSREYVDTALQKSHHLFPVCVSVQCEYIISVITMPQSFISTEDRFHGLRKPLDVHISVNH